MQSYYLFRNNENHGPYPEANIRQMLSTGQISPAEMICVAGSSDWIPASTLMPAQPAAAARPALVVPQTPARQPAQYQQPQHPQHQAHYPPPQAAMYHPAPRLGLVSAWLWIYAIGFGVAAVFVLIASANIKHEVTGKSGLGFGLLMFGLIGIFAFGFGAIAVALKKRKPWALGMARRFMIMNIFSPLFIPALIGYKRLCEPATLAAFGQNPS